MKRVFSRTKEEGNTAGGRLECLYPHNGAPPGTVRTGHDRAPWRDAPPVSRLGGYPGRMPTTRRILVA